MAAPRNYAAEYARRIARGVARGLSPAQARGHPKTGERLASNVSGRRLQGAAKRGAEQRLARAYGQPTLPPSVSWRGVTPGGTRDLVTSDPRVVMAALAEAAAAGRDALVNVVGKGSGKGRAARERSTGRRSAREIERHLASYGEEIGDAISDMDGGDTYGNTAFTSYGVYEVKMFS